jgi:hypothetical protein
MSFTDADHVGSVREVLANDAFSGGDLPTEAIRVVWAEDTPAASLFCKVRRSGNDTIGKA